jgi:single-strand DNA-binding protein
LAGEVPITIVGNLVADPELKFTPSGQAVANFTVAQTSRSWDKDTNAWKDGSSIFMRCAIWRQAAENVAESLTKGMRVVVTGTLRQRSFEVEGQKRSVIEMEAFEVGPSLRYATAKVNKVERSSTPKENPWGGGEGGDTASTSSPWGETSKGETPPF